MSVSARPRRPHGRLTFVTLVVVACAVLLGAVQANAAPAGSSACIRWNVAGNWSGSQSNGVPSITFVFQQRQGGKLIGTARVPTAKGMLAGSIKGKRVDFIVSWSAGVSGHYLGTVSAGKIVGSGFQVENKSNRTNWSAKGKARCAARSA